MAFTIEQIQTKIDSQSLDARQLINLIADYLQANPGGGGTQGIDDVLAEGQALAVARIVELNGNILQFQQGGGQYFLVLDPTVNSEVNTLRVFNNTDDGNYSMLSASTTDVLSRFLLQADFNEAVNRATIMGSADASVSALSYTATTHTFNGNIINPGLVANDFADDTAAAGGGITVGGLYHTAGAVKVRLT